MRELDEFDTLPPSMDPAADGHVLEPPTRLFGIIRKLGPGLIIAGSIVGSGELVATTKTGAQAGIALLWLIIIGCLIKVFVQVELGRYALTHGETTLAALDSVPGPRVRANWVMWLWVIMSAATVAQLGGIVGGVGQAMAITFPFTGDYSEAIRVPSQKEFQRYIAWQDDIDAGGLKLATLSPERRARVERGHAKLGQRIAALGERGRELLQTVRNGGKLSDPWTADDRIWAAAIAVMTAIVLYVGRYNAIQVISTVLVVTFTFVTIGNVISLQTTAQWHIPLSEFLYGLSFHAPEAEGGKSPWLTALATFGIIGVGASELIAYPYWCLEKGYARYTGVRTQEDSWANRARGWMKVMRYDAFASMAIYTFATLAFFLMGVAVLHNDGLDPDGMRMVSTLIEAYVPVFGPYAKWMFLAGAIAVLYSTFLVGNASNARMYTDALKIFRLIDKNSERSHEKAIATWSVILPLLCLVVFVSGANPVMTILVAGMLQSMMLPVIGGIAIYFRYTRTDARIKPTPLWDLLVVISFVGLLLAGTYGMYKQFEKLKADLTEQHAVNSGPQCPSRQFDRSLVFNSSSVRDECLRDAEKPGRISAQQTGTGGEPPVPRPLEPSVSGRTFLLLAFPSSFAAT